MKLCKAQEFLFHIMRANTVRDFLRKALLISDVVGAQGEKARIWRKQAQVLLKADPIGNAKEAERVLLSADLTRINLPGQSACTLEDTDAAWDNLVCGYYR